VELRSGNWSRWLMPWLLRCTLALPLKVAASLRCLSAMSIICLLGISSLFFLSSMYGCMLMSEMCIWDPIGLELFLFMHVWWNWSAHLCLFDSFLYVKRHQTITYIYTLSLSLSTHTLAYMIRFHLNVCVHTPFDPFWINQGECLILLSRVYYCTLAYGSNTFYSIFAVVLYECIDLWCNGTWVSCGYFLFFHFHFVFSK